MQGLQIPVYPIVQNRRGSYPIRRTAVPYFCCDQCQSNSDGITAHTCMYTHLALSIACCRACIVRLCDSADVDVDKSSKVLKERDFLTA